MNDEQILEKGGTEDDIVKYAEQNGGNLTKEDFMPNTTNEWEEKLRKTYPLNTFTGKTQDELVSLLASERSKSYEQGVIDTLRGDIKLSKLKISQEISVPEIVVKQIRAKLIKEIEDKMPKKIVLGVDCKISIEDYAKSFNDCLYTIKSLLNSLK